MKRQVLMMTWVVDINFKTKLTNIKLWKNRKKTQHVDKKVVVDLGETLIACCIVGK